MRMALPTLKHPFVRSLAVSLSAMALFAGCVPKQSAMIEPEAAIETEPLVAVATPVESLPEQAIVQPEPEAEPLPPADPLLAGLNPEDLALVQAMAKAQYLGRWEAVSERSRFLRQRLLDGLEQANAPHSLQVIPIVESTYNPYALSRSGAMGLWQLMPRTARGLGIKPRRDVDGRRHIETSTKAAATYLLALHDRFGNWPLALAAYNMGPNALAKRLAKSPWDKQDGLEKMPAPEGTRAYVQHILGLAVLMHLKTVSLPDPEATRELELQAPIDIQQLALAAGMEKDKIFHFNPGLNQAQYLNGSITIEVPASKYEALLAGAEAAKPRYVQVEVKKGDSLWLIARKHHISVAALKQLNGNKIGKTLSIGQKLKVPANQLATAKATVNPMLSAGNRILYKVRSGDSLWLIAKRFGTTPQAIARHNQLSVKATIRPGDTLWVHARI